MLTFLDLEGGGRSLDWETLTAIGDGEGGGEGVGGVGRFWEEGRKWRLLYFNKL